MNSIFIEVCHLFRKLMRFFTVRFRITVTSVVKITYPFLIMSLDTQQWSARLSNMMVVFSSLCTTCMVLNHRHTLRLKLTPFLFTYFCKNWKKTKEVALKLYHNTNTTLFPSLHWHKSPKLSKLKAWSQVISLSLSCYPNPERTDMKCDLDQLVICICQLLVWACIISWEFL